MNDEIKEMFDTKLYFDLEEEDYIKIKDYITNLQQENERLKANIRTQKSRRRLQTRKKNDYKSRCEKAIEYINHAQNYGTMAQVMPHLKPYVNGNDLLNILQNGGDSQ